MDAQVKGYLEAWGARLLHLAATDPQAYIETRYETDQWWREWQTEHRADVSELETQVALVFLHGTHKLIDDYLRDNPDAINEPLPPDMPEIARGFAPGARTYGEYLKGMREFFNDAGMYLLTNPEDEDAQ